MTPVRVAIAGASGRMGRMLIEAALKDEGIVLAAAFDRPGSAFIGRDAGEMAGVASGVSIVDDAAAALAAADCLIDFTRPEGTLHHLALARELGKAAVIGTTGFDAAGKAAIAAAAADIPVVFAPNMAVGVNAVFRLLEVAARILDQGYDVEVIEAHHRFKVDAPSGTALMLGQAAADGRGVSLDETSVRSRDGHTGARKRGDIGFATLRGGNVVGEHSVVFAADGERVVLSHIATDRGIFARGAVKAALWGRGKGPGLFTMADGLGI